MVKPLSREKIEGYLILKRNEFPSTGEGYRQGCIETYAEMMALLEYGNFDSGEPAFDVDCLKYNIDLHISELEVWKNKQVLNSKEFYRAQGLLKGAKNCRDTVDCIIKYPGLCKKDLQSNHVKDCIGGMIGCIEKISDAGMIVIKDFYKKEEKVEVKETPRITLCHDSLIRCLDSVGKHSLKCPDCGRESTKWYDSEIKAIEAWNNGDGLFVQVKELTDEVEEKTGSFCTSCGKNYGFLGYCDKEKASFCRECSEKRSKNLIDADELIQYIGKIYIPIEFDSTQYEAFRCALEEVIKAISSRLPKKEAELKRCPSGHISCIEKYVLGFMAKCTAHNCNWKIEKYFDTAEKTIENWNKRV